MERPIKREGERSRHVNMLS